MIGDVADRQGGDIRDTDPVARHCDREADRSLEPAATAQCGTQATRYTIKRSPLEPAFQELLLSSMPVVRSIKQGVGRRLLMVEGYDAENTSPIDELHTVISQKQAHAADLVTAYSGLTGQFSGQSPCDVLYITGNSARTLRTELLNAGSGRDYDHGFTAMMMAMGSPADLLFLLQLLGGDA